MKYLDLSEKESLEAFCWSRASTRPRDAAIILTALATGTRARELLNLTYQDLDLAKPSLKIKTLKGGKNREIPISRKLANLLIASRRGDRIFPISYPRLHQIWTAWRPSKLPFHALRHTFAMSAYNRTKDINLVKHIMGHRSLSSTTVYLEAAFTDKQLKNAVGA